MPILILCINFLVIAGIAFWWWRSLSGFASSVFWPSLIFKLSAGISLGLVYRYYYGSGDTFYFFEEARELANIFFSNAWKYVQFIIQHPDAVSSEEGSLRTTFLVKVISFFALFTGSNYWIISLWFSFISFLASFYLFMTVTKCVDKSEVAAALAFLFFPSVIFWSAGIIKESVGLAALFMITAFFLEQMKGEKGTIQGVILTLVCLWIVWNLKYYWLAIFMPVVITSIVCQYAFHYFKISSRYKLISWVLLFLLLTLGISITRPNFYPGRILGVIADNYHAFAAVSDRSDLIEYYKLSATWQSIALNSPWALFSGLFRPFLWEANNILKIIASIENLFILVLCFTSLSRLKVFSRSPHKLLALSVIVYAVMLCIFLALSTPNLGSLSRYKVGFLPFLVFIVSYKNPLIEHLLLFRKTK